MHIVDTRDWRQVRVCADLSSLPQRLDLLSGSRRDGLLLIFLGASWVILPTSMAFLGSDMSLPVFAFLAAFALIGAGAVYGGFAALHRREWAVLGQEGVDHHSVRLHGSKSWSLPYSAYQGVLYRIARVHTKKRHIDFQIVELRHDDPEKCVPLYVSRAREVPRTKLESYARALNLPALEFEGQALATRQQGDLDKPLAERVAEGKVASAFDPDAPPPDGLLVTRDSPDSYTIGFTVHRKPVSHYVGALAFGLLTIGSSIFLGSQLIAGHFIIQAVAIAVCLLVFLVGLVLCWMGIGGFYRDRTTPRVLKVDRGQISIDDPLRSRLARRELSTLSFDEIESIFVDDRKNRYVDKPVVIVSDDGRMPVGGGLSPEAANWLKDFLIAAVATA